MSFEEYKRIIISLDVIIYLFCLIGINQISQKSDLPFIIEKSDSGLVLRNPEAFPQDKSFILKSVDGFVFTSREDLEVYTDFKTIGQAVRLELASPQDTTLTFVPTVNFYSPFYIFTVIITGTLFFLIAGFVLFRSSDKKASILFHLVVIATAVIMMTTWGNVNMRPYPVGYIVRMIFHAAYLTAPVLFLHFKLSFPLDRSHKYRTALVVLYSAGLIIALIQSILFIDLHSNDFSGIPVYTAWFNLGRLFFIACVTASLVVFIHSFIIIKARDQRKKLKWLLLGYLTGPAAFVMLWVIPQAFSGEGLLPEAVIIMLMTAIPVTFAISILKYHLLDIDLILNRSFVYTIVIGSLLVIYMLLVSFLVNLTDRYAKDIPVVAAIIIALIFQPAKKYIQGIVDTKFFRVTYNYRQVIKRILREINNCSNLISVSEKVITEVNQLIPVNRSAFYLYNSKGKSLSILSHQNMDHIQDKKYYMKSDDVMIHSPSALRDAVEKETGIVISDSKLFRVFNLAAIFPVKSPSGEIFAFIVLGRKKSGTRFTVEDIDLLLQVASEAGAAIERIYLNEMYISEHFERKKLEELNEIKSFFVSGVSHELKTPITCIKMFSEILNTNKLLDDSNRAEYFRIIDGECSRLTRMIDNVLNLVKIEKGIKTYRFEAVDIDETVDEALHIMEYQLTANKFCVNSIRLSGEKIISADKDAILEVLVNLISNSIKYSRDTKEIVIRTGYENERIMVVVEDKGIGIPEKDIDSVFKPYFRSSDPEAKRISGTGLGLAIVKHVIDAHNGVIQVDSQPGKGTAVKLLFNIEGTVEA